jgi:hypothetical protein
MIDGQALLWVINRPNGNQNNDLRDGHSPSFGELIFGKRYNSGQALSCMGRGE